MYIHVCSYRCTYLSLSWYSQTFLCVGLGGWTAKVQIVRNNPANVAKQIGSMALLIMIW